MNILFSRILKNLYFRGHFSVMVSVEQLIFKRPQFFELIERNSKGKNKLKETTFSGLYRVAQWKWQALLFTGLKQERSFGFGLRFRYWQCFLLRLPMQTLTYTMHCLLLDAKTPRTFTFIVCHRTKNLAVKCYWGTHIQTLKKWRMWICVSTTFKKMSFLLWILRGTDSTCSCGKNCKI